MSIAKMAAVAALLLLVLVAVPVTMAVDYEVGGASGWTQGIDYTTWTKGKTFRVGDVLEFKYGSTHTVEVVDKDGYDNCDTSKSTQSFTDGDTKIPLNATGAFYFICGTPGHCPNGMKLTVTVVAASSGATPGTPSTPQSPSPPSSTPSTPPSSPGSPPERTPPRPSGATRGLTSYAVMGVSMVLGYGVWIMG